MEITVHNRKMDRAVAHARMRKSEIKQINKKKGDGKSFFAKNWRKWC